MLFFPFLFYLCIEAEDDDSQHINNSDYSEADMEEEDEVDQYHDVEDDDDDVELGKRKAKPTSSTSKKSKSAVSRPPPKKVILDTKEAKRAEKRALEEAAARAAKAVAAQEKAAGWRKSFSTGSLVSAEDDLDYDFAPTECVLNGIPFRSHIGGGYMFFHDKYKGRWYVKIRKDGSTGYGVSLTHDQYKVLKDAMVMFDEKMKDAGC